MALKPEIGDLVGDWTYRSFLSIPDVNTPFDKLEFGRGTLTIGSAPMGALRGTIGGDDWSLDLNGSIRYGDPYTIRFQGTGTIGGAPWVYDYVGHPVAAWPNGINQVPTIVGTIVRTIKHGQSEAGVVASWIAVFAGATSDV